MGWPDLIGAYAGSGALYGGSVSAQPTGCCARKWARKKCKNDDKPPSRKKGMSLGENWKGAALERGQHRIWPASMAWSIIRMLLLQSLASAW